MAQPQASLPNVKPSVGNKASSQLIKPLAEHKNAEQTELLGVLVLFLTGSVTLRTDNESARDSHNQSLQNHPALPMFLDLLMT